ncbi:MAG: hypothetical protein Q7I99_04335 [Acholeplasmataceae bacterium]|nr:hypothetical protein [Acholeplasmataceae bacterium]
MKMSLVHYIKWSIFSFSIIFMNLVILLNLYQEYMTVFYALALFFILFIVLSESLLNKKLDMNSDFYQIGLFFCSVLQITVGFLGDIMLAFLPSLLVLALIVVKFVKMRSIYFEFENQNQKSFVLTLYFISFTLLALTLAVKSQYIYLLIGFIPLYFMSAYLMVSNFKEFEKRQYFIYLSILSLILIFLSTTVLNRDSLRYDILFNLEYVIVSSIAILHLIPILKIAKREIETLSKKRKKVKIK